MFQRKIVLALALVLSACPPLAAQQAGGTKVACSPAEPLPALVFLSARTKNCDAASALITARRKTMPVTLTGWDSISV
jgi:hypothetical protein